jgi:site-specific recombinase XerD
MKQIPLKDSVETYMRYLQNDVRVTPNTLRGYRSTLTAYAERFSTLNPQSVKAFLRGYDNPASANTCLVRLNGFAGAIDVNLDSIPRAKEIVKDPEALSSRELETLVQAAGQVGGNQMMHSVVLLGQTGLRIHEFYNLTQKSLQTSDGVAILKIFGKGRKFRDVPLTDRALLSFNGLNLPFGISERRFRDYLEKAGEQAEIRFKVNPHKLRSTCASIMLNEKRIDSAFVAKILGWSRVDTMVKLYFKPDMRTMKQEMERSVLG